MSARSLLCLASVSASLVALSCAGVPGRRYSMPLSDGEGSVLVPALVSTAESMGLRAANYQTSAQVRLADGTSLWWMPYGAQFVLNIELGHVQKGADLDAAFRDAKVRADEIWGAAVQARQSNSIGATVVVGQQGNQQAQQPGPAHPGNPPMYPQPQHPTQPAYPQPQYGQPRPMGQPAQQQAGGLPAGASCRFSSDCAGGNCRSNQCMGQGGPGAPCWFSSDCNSSSCRDHVCQ
jgi:hypothetical protein